MRMKNSAYCHHFIMLEGLVGLHDPRSYVVGQLTLVQSRKANWS